MKNQISFNYSISLVFHTLTIILFSKYHSFSVDFMYKEYFILLAVLITVNKSEELDSTLILCQI